MSSTRYSPADGIDAAVDAAAKSADDAIRSSQRMANSALDGMSNQVESARNTIGPALDGFATDAVHLMQRGNDALHKSGAQVRDSAQHVRDATRGYIQNAPLQSVLMAAAAGAAVVWLSSLLGRSSTR